jgi:hypothetical protein
MIEAKRFAHAMSDLAGASVVASDHFTQHRKISDRLNQP